LASAIDGQELDEEEDEGALAAAAASGAGALRLLERGGIARLVREGADASRKSGDAKMLLRKLLCLSHRAVENVKERRAKSIKLVISFSSSSSSISRKMDLASAHTNAKALILSLRDGIERLEKAEAVSF
jgi:hypothetical protein